MPAGMMVGSSTNFVGDGYVGSGNLSFLYASTGELALSGAAVKSRQVSKYPTGSVELSSAVVKSVLRSIWTVGEFDLSAIKGISSRQQTKGVGGSFDLSGAAGIDIQSTFSYRLSSGGFSFEGAAAYNRGYDYTVEDGALTFSGEVSRAGKSTRFPAGITTFQGAATLNKTKNYTAVPGFIFSGAGSNSVRSTSTVWESVRPSIAGNNLPDDSSVWEGLVPDEPETESVPVSVWKSSGGGGGTIVGGGGVW